MLAHAMALASQGLMHAGAAVGPVARLVNRPDLLGGVTTVVTAGYRRRLADDGSWWPYRAPAPDAAPTGDLVELTAIPYYAWANRQDGAMRVWLPTS